MSGLLSLGNNSENLYEKNLAISEQAREAGNQLYKREQHDPSDHRNILLQYSKSIAFAPENNSEELAKAYGNRSALLLRLRRYKKCLVDVDRALKITQSSELKKKLKFRKQKCLDLMKNPDVEQYCEEPTLKLPRITPSTILQSASEAVTIKYNEKYGRHLVATRDIKPGEIIIVERFYVGFPVVCLQYLICSHCLIFAWNGLPCKSCAFAVYCSESCRENAWEQYHDVECNYILSHDKNIDYVPDSIVAFRLFIIAVKKEGLHTVIKEASKAKINQNQVERLIVDGKIHSDKFRCCINLHTGVTGSDESISSDAVNALYEYLSNKDENNDVTNKYSVDQLKNILLKLRDVVYYNAYKYQAESKCKNLTECSSKCMCNRGKILALCSSLINHSCNNNVHGVFLPNGKMASFTIAPVKKGEQLFDNYGTSFSMEKEERQSMLQNDYKFICECQRCNENWPSNPQLLRVDERKEQSIFLKIRKEFVKSFPDASESTIWKNPDEWQYNKETLKHAVRLSELVYKYFDNNMQRDLYNNPYSYYIINAYFALYGEKSLEPYEC